MTAHTSVNPNECSLTNPIISHFVAAQQLQAAADITSTTIVADQGPSLHAGDRVTGRPPGPQACTFAKPWQAYQETYFAGWGAGLRSSVLAEFWHTWNSSGVYDGVLNAIMGSRRSVAPCSPRLRLLPNVGTHGDARERWDHYLPEVRWQQTPPWYTLVDYTASPAAYEAVVPWAWKWVVKNDSSSGGGSSIISKRVWSSDLHVAPIADLKELWQHLLPRGVRVTVTDHSLSGSCKEKGTCKRGMPWLSGLRAEKPNESLSVDFAREFGHGPEVDVFVCNHPASLCTVFEQFGRALWIHASTRYELGKNESEDWLKWNQQLTKWHAAADGHDHGDGNTAPPAHTVRRNNVIAANNVYDAEYIQHFTGIAAHYMPSYCDVGVVYTGPSSSSDRTVLLAMPQAVENALLPLIEAAARRSSSNTRFVHVRRLYPRYKHEQLSNHPAILHVPYQVSLMSILEQYRMGLPIIVPSLALLSEWHVQHGLVFQRVWATVFGRESSRSPIDGHPASRHGHFDPNAEKNPDAVAHWLAFSDFYTLPHVLTFESFEHLVHLVDHTDWAAVSARMRSFNVQQRNRLLEAWALKFRSLNVES
jgi:hypothetical protein